MRQISKEGRHFRPAVEASLLGTLYHGPIRRVTMSQSRWQTFTIVPSWSIYMGGQVDVSSPNHSSAALRTTCKHRIYVPKPQVSVNLYIIIRFQNFSILMAQVHFPVCEVDRNIWPCILVKAGISITCHYRLLQCSHRRHGEGKGISRRSTAVCCRGRIFLRKYANLARREWG